MTVTQRLRDPATGLLSRQALADELDRQQAILARFDTPFALIVASLDDLDLEASRRGTAAVDEMLRDIGQTVVNHVRETDLVARYGPAQFAIVLVHVGADEARAYVERLRRVLEASVQSPAGPRIEMAAVSGRSGESTCELCRRVDGLLAHAQVEPAGTALETPGALPTLLCGQEG